MVGENRREKRWIKCKYLWWGFPKHIHKHNMSSDASHLISTYKQSGEAVQCQEIQIANANFLLTSISAMRKLNRDLHYITLKNYTHRTLKSTDPFKVNKTVSFPYTCHVAACGTFSCADTGWWCCDWMLCRILPSFVAHLTAQTPKYFRITEYRLFFGTNFK